MVQGRGHYSNFEREKFSNVPVMVKDFIKSHPDLWKGKKILCVATMGLFSGDGAGCSARLLKKYGAKIVGGFHIRMPDSVCDVKLLKKKLSGESGNHPESRQKD